MKPRFDSENTNDRIRNEALFVSSPLLSIMGFFHPVALQRMVLLKDCLVAPIGSFVFVSPVLFGVRPRAHPTAVLFATTWKDRQLSIL